MLKKSDYEGKPPFACRSRITNEDTVWLLKRKYLQLRPWICREDHIRDRAYGINHTPPLP